MMFAMSTVIERCSRTLLALPTATIVAGAVLRARVAMGLLNLTTGDTLLSLIGLTIGTLGERLIGGLVGAGIGA